MTNFLNALKSSTNYTLTENGAISHKSTLNKLMDMFAFGGAYRKRSEDDCILLFKEALEENTELAMKCLFYLRAFRGVGQGERRFFRVCYQWLAKEHPEIAKRNLKYIPELGRWDDLLILLPTSLRLDVAAFFNAQLRADANYDAPSLCAKWAPSINCSDPERVKQAKFLASYMGLTAREYRKMLVNIRKKINLVESNMSQDHWDEIKFNKLPSKAGLKYRKAFANNETTADRYKEFMSSKQTKVNAGTLMPYEVVNAATELFWRGEKSVERDVVNKYWENLTDYFNGSTFNALCVCDTSASMRGSEPAAPINVAISLAMYCAERNKGPFHNHYISFSCQARLIEVEGVDFFDKVKRIFEANLCENTNIESVFDLILNTAIWHEMKQEDLPENVIIISDMEFDAGRRDYDWGDNPFPTTLLDSIAKRWEKHGYKLPKLIYWNVNARANLIPSFDKSYTYISGCNPTIFQQLMTGKTGYDLMLEALNNPAFEGIH